MKHLLLLLALLCTINSTSQEVYLFIDPSNAVRGSEKNDPGLNYKIGISDYSKTLTIRIGMEFEQFKEINYIKWTFFKLDKDIFITDKIYVTAGGGISQIFRPRTLRYGSSAFSYSMNLDLNYKMNERFTIAAQAHKERATDISQIWRNAAYLGLRYNLKI